MARRLCDRLPSEEEGKGRGSIDGLSPSYEDLSTVTFLVDWRGGGVGRSEWTKQMCEICVSVCPAAAGRKFPLYEPQTSGNVTCAVGASGG